LLAVENARLAQRLFEFRNSQRATIAAMTLPEL
jgi:hypothetical protein